MKVSGFLNSGPLVFSSFFLGALILTVCKILVLSKPYYFSQVGGFLGLLLGASILTVCEILDFIVLAVVAIWNEKKTKGQVTHL